MKIIVLLAIAIVSIIALSGFSDEDKNEKL